jgi:hypothetical protein
MILVPFIAHELEFDQILLKRWQCPGTAIPMQPVVDLQVPPCLIGSQVHAWAALSPPRTHPLPFLSCPDVDFDPPRWGDRA